jgi:signal transduction histidine kinase
MASMAPVIDRLTALRVVFVLIGSGLALSFVLLDVTVIASLAVSDAIPMWTIIVIGTVLVVGPVVGFGLVPATRSIEATAATSLLGVEFADGTPGPARDWPQRRRSLAWFVIHLLAGAVPVGLIVLAIQFADAVWTGVLAVAMAIAVVLLGRGLAALAPSLLGPSYAERLARLERDVDRATERNRIAREIHDSVGHALSLVTVQAAAARKVLGHDPSFAQSALEAIEQASRSAAADLDHMLGVLREDDVRPRRPVPDLASVDTLLTATEAAGLEVAATVPTELVGELPVAISREAYRIVQEGLTNAIRYASPRRAAVRVSAPDRMLVLLVTNPTSSHHSGRQGRGLRGISERAAALGGDMCAGMEQDHWRLLVRLPLAGVGR